jgi:predicted  nucleic acid-binding Zn-ribbon protein
MPNKSNFKSQPLQPDFKLKLSALKNENLKFQKKIAKLEVEIITLRNKIKLITQEYTKYKHDHSSFDRPLTEHEKKLVDECKQCLKRKALERDLNT